VIRRQHLVLCAAVLVVACSRQQAPEPPPSKVTVAHPIERELTDWDEYTARLDAVDSVEVRARVSGYLESVHFREGSLVNKGDLLFQIDPRPYEAQLHRAQGDLEQANSRVNLAQKNLARVAFLIKSQAMSKEEAETREALVRQAVAGVAAAQAAVDAAKLDVEFTRITAPVSGRVSRKFVTESNLINGGIGTQGTLLTTIVSLDPLYVYFEANERDYLKYVRLAKSGARPSSRDFKNPVYVATADEQGFPHEGYMDFVDNQLDVRTGTIRARAVLENKNGQFTPGMFARVQLLGSVSRDVLNAYHRPVVIV
jgi:RND family efflux transporter MFP subunit